MIQTGDRIVALGDSITWYGAHPGGWCRLVTAQLLAAGIDVRIFGAGVSGNNSTQMAAREPTEVRPYAPRWVTLLAGTNDALGSQAQSVELYVAGLQAVIDQAEARRARVLLLTPPRTEPPHNPATNVTLRPYVAACRAVAADNPDVLLADLHAATLASREILTFDGTHPNTAGHAVIAAAVLGAWGLETP